MTLCTIAIPVFNRRDLIVPALESARSQEVPGLEILVVDNASTDGTWERLQSVTDPRFRLVRNPVNLGLFGNFNRCLELARGKYLRFLCSDDRLKPHCLAGEIALLEQYPQAALLSTRGFLTDGEFQHPRPFADYLKPGIYRGPDMIGTAFWILVHYGSPFNFPSGILLRREAALRGGRFDTSLTHLGDIDYWLKVLTCGDLAVSGQAGCEVRVHAEQISHTLLAQGQFTHEWFLLARRWEEHLRRHNLHRQILNQAGAIAVRIAFHFWRRGQPEIARLYWKTALEQSPSRWGLWCSCARLLGTTLLARACKIRLRPKKLCRPMISFQ